ncbi:hypothetical protein CCY01nite_15310 [Chitinophaga cymbidii]|uniref:Uncharacterized protein n=1 Tax=Chitinophaga cymbidii TaxID=1096750 RepID=A0A512RHX0_9BACT|nr:hypothetical protein CCY01nite_15310 [Chitinophaga cymbidii]
MLNRIKFNLALFGTAKLRWKNRITSVFGLFFPTTFYNELIFNKKFDKELSTGYAGPVFTGVFGGGTDVIRCPQA